MPKQPNFIFLISDQHRWDFMSYANNGVTNTPHLQSLADSGMRFNRAYCNAPLCSPSRAAIASGRYGMNSGSFTNLHRLPADTPTFNRQLQEAG
ncbi:MAG: sulfatase-like hydrolase/transferase, partial [Planctomycetes bacterium]|nr:sulfatase-like hydrolase/transferase [Planctomycetota bacterium]